MRRKLIILNFIQTAKNVCLLLFILSFSSIFGQINSSSDTCEGDAPDLYRVLFILDGSYSMDRKLGKETLWEISQKIIQDFAFFIQKNYNVEMGLRVYGHRSPLNAQDCTDSHLEVPIAKNQAQNIAKKLKQITYRGSTPLTYSLEKAAEDLGCNNHKNIIILITDGFESCASDPCSAADKLQDFRILIKPIILGLNINQSDMKHMECIGDFYDIRTKESFKKNLYESFEKATNLRTLSIFLKNKNTDTSETDIPITITNSKKEVIGHYIHNLNARFSPDTFTIGNFDTIGIQIHSIPPVFHFPIQLKKHIVNPIVIPAPYFNLKVNWDISNAKINLNDKIDAILWKDSTIVYRNTIPFEAKIIEGTYWLDILTTPPNRIQIEAKARENVLKSIETYGIFSLVKSFPMVGDIYKYEKGVPIKVASLQPQKSFEKWNLAPGKYLCIYRSIRALTQYGTFEKEWEIKSGDQVNLTF